MRKPNTFGKTHVELLAGIAVCCLVAVLVVWMWFLSAARMKHPALGSESSEAVKKEYPLASASEDLPEAVPALAQNVVKSNPFNVQRRQMKTDVGVNANASQQAAQTPKGPLFVYKGRVNVGKRQRAVVEETTAHKTHFLEVGQEVAGFKVLDIDETQVILSDLQTGKELTVSLASKASP